MQRRSQVIRSEQRKGLLWAIPAWGVAQLLVVLVGSFSENAWLVAVMLLLLVVALGILGRPLVRERRLLLGGGFLPFFFCFCLLFSIAAGTKVLDGKQTLLTGYEKAVPPNFLGLNRYGDWHYRLAPKAPAADDLVIVTLPALADSNDRRWTFASLIFMAVNNKAKGIAFDYYFRQRSDVDEVLCEALKAAEAAPEPVPVFFVYSPKSVPGGVLPDTLPSTLSGCLPRERQTSPVGYQEPDGRIRMVPLTQPGNSQYPSLSLKMAECLVRADTTKPNLKPPRDELLQFLEPEAAVRTFDAGSGASFADPSAVAWFPGRCVLVGSRAGDRHDTPFDSLQGTTIHAYAANSWATRSFILRLERLWAFPSIFLLCFLLIALQARGGGRKVLLLGALGLSVVIITGAALAIFAWVWVDVSYPLVAVWGLTGLLMGGARFQAARTRARAVPPLGTTIGTQDEAAECDHFDVFLSYNRQDKDAVLDLARALKNRGLCVWLDLWEIPPGGDWQQALEVVIETVASTVVLIGKEGLGPWEEPEMRASLDQCVGRGMPVIPVLLPGVSARPKLPLFLRRFSWLDLRDGVTEAGLDRLEWGITGLKPQKQKTG